MHGIRWILGTGLGACAAASALVVALVAARVLATGSLGFAFLVYNLVLAWVPLLAALAVQELVDSRWRILALPLAAAWLAFLPNAPYLLTDLQHLAARPPVPLWFDAAMLGGFAAVGLLITGVSVHAMARAADRVLPRAVIAGGLVAVGPLVGLGIYLGRFLRWNSWDLAFRPALVLADIADRLVDPLAHPRTWAVTALGAAVTWVAWAAVASLGVGRPAPAVEAEVRRRTP